MRTTRAAKVDHCPSCGSVLSADSDPEGSAVPQPGDLGVCVYCGSFLVFKEDLTRRTMDLREIAQLDDETRSSLMRARALVDASKRSLGEDS